MTSEFKTRDIWEVANQLEGYVGPDTEERLAVFLMREGKEAAKLAERIVELEEELNTRVVPDVPELVRYTVRLDRSHYEGMVVTSAGAYVRYDQAAAVIAAEISRERHLHQKQLSEVTERLTGDYLELLAKLAQIKAQEPVGYIDLEGMSCIGLVETATVHTRIERTKTKQFKYPLYAAPVDQTVEIERLREELGTLKTERHADAEYIGSLKAEIERLREVISMTRNHISGEVFVGDKRLLDLVDTALSGKDKS